MRGERVDDRVPAEDPPRAEHHEPDGHAGPCQHADHADGPDRAEAPADRTGDDPGPQHLEHDPHRIGQRGRGAVQRQRQRPAHAAHQIGGADRLDGLDRRLGREQRDVAAVPGEPAHRSARIDDRRDPRQHRGAERGQRPAEQGRDGGELSCRDQGEGDQPRDAGAEQVGHAREADPVLGDQAVRDPGAVHRDRGRQPAREREQGITGDHERDQAQAETAQRGQARQGGLVVAQLHRRPARSAQQARPHVADRRVLQGEEARKREVHDREVRIARHRQGQHRQHLDHRGGGDLPGDHPEIGGVLHGVLAVGDGEGSRSVAPSATIREAAEGSGMPRSTAVRR